MKTQTTLLSIIAVAVCSLRFLFDGVDFTFFGHHLSVGHTDPMSYGTYLTPILGAHGYVHGKKIAGAISSALSSSKPQVDNPDA